MRIHCYQNADVHWIELSGPVGGTPAPQIRAAVAAAFSESLRGAPGALRCVLDLSQVPAIGDATLAAVLEALPLAVGVDLIPPPGATEVDEVAARTGRLVTVHPNERATLRALDIASRGAPRPPPKEPRRHARILTKIRTRVELERPEGTLAGRALVADLSRSGARLVNLEWELGLAEIRLFAAGAGRLVLELLIAERRCRLAGRVVRLDTPHGALELGLEFEGLEPPVEEALARLLGERGRPR
jgi:hypothetical protein